MTFQSNNGKAFVGDLTKELMRRSHIAQAYLTIYHPQTNGLEERQNRTLVKMIKVYCSKYMTDWDQSFHDANRQGKSNASNFLQLRIQRAEDITPSLREGSDQATSRVVRTMQNEYSLNTDGITEEV